MKYRIVIEETQMRKAWHWEIYKWSEPYWHQGKEDWYLAYEPNEGNSEGWEKTEFKAELKARQRMAYILARESEDEKIRVQKQKTRRVIEL